MANALQELAWRYLEKLYELSEGGLNPQVDYRKVQAELGCSNAEFRSAGDYLESKDLISWEDCTVPNVRITTRGIDVMQNSYAEKEILVLKKIYDLSDQNTLKIVGLHELVAALGMTDREVSGFCKGLEGRGFIEWPGDFVHITREGIDAIDSLGQPPPKGGGDTYNLHIGTSHGPIQQGSGNTQNIQVNVTNNSDFDQAIAGLLQLIEASGLQRDEAEELKDEVIKLNKLAVSEPRPGLLEKAKARIDVAKVGFDGAKLLVAASPHLHTAWEYLKLHLGG